MTQAAQTRPDPPIPGGHPFEQELEGERRGWGQLVALCRRLTPDECERPGYYTDPDWAVRDVIAHIGTWLAKAETQLARIRAGTYEGHEIDVDAVNAQLLEAMRGQPWSVAWVQANSARTRMLQTWYSLRERTDEAAWWIRKAGPEHYDEHLPRLEEWVAELVSARSS